MVHTIPALRVSAPLLLQATASKVCFLAGMSVVLLSLP
jgi:hypothetical protein